MKNDVEKWGYFGAKRGQMTKMLLPTIDRGAEARLLAEILRHVCNQTAKNVEKRRAVLVAKAVELWYIDRAKQIHIVAREVCVCVLSVRGKNARSGSHTLCVLVDLLGGIGASAFFGDAASLRHFFVSRKPRARRGWFGSAFSYGTGQKNSF